MFPRTAWQTVVLPLVLVGVVLAMLHWGLRERLGTQPEIVREELPFPYEEDFTAGVVPESYYRLSGNWEVRDASLVQLSTTGFDLSAMIPVLAAPQQPYLYETRLRFLGGNPGGGIAFNVQNPNTRQRSHMARFNQDAGQLWLIYGYFGDDNSFQGQGATALEIDPTTRDWQTLAVLVDENTYSLYVNGIAVAQDIPQEYSGGGVGLVTAAGQVAFDDLRAEFWSGQGGASLLAGESTLPLIWQDRLDAETDASLWVPISGEWAFSGEGLRQSMPEGFDHLMIRQDEIPLPARLSVVLRHPGPAGGGLMFNVPDLDGKNGGHMLRFVEGGSALAWGYFSPEGDFVGQGSASVPPPGVARQRLSVDITAAGYAVYLNDQRLVRGVPLMSERGYVALTTSESAAVFEEVALFELAPDLVTQAAALDISTISGRWVSEGGVTRQLDDDPVDYIAGTGILAESFSLEMQVEMDAEGAPEDVGAGLVFHMQGRSDPLNGAMVRFDNGGQEVFWGVYSATGTFQGVGSAALPYGPGQVLTLGVQVGQDRYAITVNDVLIAEDIPLETTRGWLGLVSFRGPTRFSNVVLTLGDPQP
ncbi:MAG: hypothetical protein HC915_01510 [Anaerolineae bacterium]|nr:hypothetical protein [Anaerolineae bacterium]